MGKLSQKEPDGVEQFVIEIYVFDENNEYKGKYYQVIHNRSNDWVRSLTDSTQWLIEDCSNCHLGFAWWAKIEEPIDDIQFNELYTL